MGARNTIIPPIGTDQLTSGSFSRLHSPAGDDLAPQPIAVALEYAAAEKFCERPLRTGDAGGKSFALACFRLPPALKSADEATSNIAAWFHLPQRAPAGFGRRSFPGR
jgi:hypothetical protein